MSEEKKQKFLTQEQKDKIKKLYPTTPDLIKLTREIFKDYDLDGRSWQGRLVRKYLIDEGLNYRTTKTVAKKEVELTDYHKKYIEENCEDSIVEIANVLFAPKKFTTPLHAECREIELYIKKEKLRAKDTQGNNYSPPSTEKQTCFLINRYASQELDYKDLNHKNKERVNMLMKYMKTPLYKRQIDAYHEREDRELMESEFVRYVWDKPDLTTEDLTRYIHICADTVRAQKVIEQQQSLDFIFKEATRGDEVGNVELTQRLAENIKAINQEAKDIQSRINTSIKAVQKDRSQRRDDKGSRNATFLNLVESFQEEEERKMLLAMAKANRLKVKDEVGRLESLPEFKARILGLRKEEVV